MSHYYIRLGNVNEPNVVPLRQWVMEHQNLFPQYQFTNSQSDHPTTYQIRDLLMRDFGYMPFEENGDIIMNPPEIGFRF